MDSGAQSTNLSKIEALILDFDGVLSDASELLHEHASMVLKEFGVEMKMSVEDIWHLAGLEGFIKENDTFAAVLAIDRAHKDIDNIFKMHNSSAEVKELVKEHVNETEMQMINTARKKTQWVLDAEDEVHKSKVHIIDGSADVVRKLMNDGYLVGVVSNAPRKRVVRGAVSLGIEDYLIACWEDVPETKPHPAGLAMMILRLEKHAGGKHINPAYVACVGDNVIDMLAATAMGCMPIGVCTGQSTRENLLAAGATLVFKDLREFYTTLSNEPQ